MTSSSEREALKQAFLERAGFADARRAPLPGDASTRSYERLHLPSGGTVMLMNQPPAAETPPCGPVTRSACTAASGRARRRSRAQRSAP